jgi:hypothetical protein
MSLYLWLTPPPASHSGPAFLKPQKYNNKNNFVPKITVKIQLNYIKRGNVSMHLIKTVTIMFSHFLSANENWPLCPVHLLHNIGLCLLLYLPISIRINFPFYSSASRCWWQIWLPLLLFILFFNCILGLMPLFLFFKTQTMHIKWNVHNSIAIFSLIHNLIQWWDSNPCLLFFRRTRWPQRITTRDPTANVYNTQVQLHSDSFLLLSWQLLI